MCSRAFAAWPCTVLALSLSCAGGAPTGSERASLASDGPDGTADTPCSSSWRVLNGPSIGRGNEPAQHRASEVELEVEKSAGFQVGRSSVVHSAQGDQLLVELRNTEDRWRCGIRSYPRLGYDAAGGLTTQPAADDSGYGILAATGMRVATREGIRGSCLGPGELGYLQIRVDAALAKVTLRLEAIDDGMELGPPPSCAVPETYSYSQGKLSIASRKAGLTDSTYTAADGGGLAMVLALDAEGLPVAMYSFAPTAPTTTSATSDDAKLTFEGLISLNAGTSQALSVLVW